MSVTVLQKMWLEKAFQLQLRISLELLQLTKLSLTSDHQEPHSCSSPQICPSLLVSLLRQKDSLSSIIKGGLTVGG